MKKRKGITLIALVVTIVVLLILAGVTVAFTLGEGGIIEKSKSTAVASRYGTIMDKVKARDMALELHFAKDEEGESREEFINRLIDEDLITKDDTYAENFSTISIGLQSNGEYKYIINLADGSYNDPNKNLTLIIQTTVANEEVEIPLWYTKGITINWDSIKDPNNFNVPEEEFWPKHIYEKAGTYEVQLKGKNNLEETYGMSGFGGEGNQEDGPYKNKNIVGLKSWGENGFKTFNSFGSSLRGNLPIPSNNTFINTTIFFETFENCVNLTGIPGNLFSNGSAIKGFEYVFTGCSGLKNIPKNLFLSNTSVTSFRSTFQNCTALTSIPENLFSANSSVTNFSDTFSGCTALTSIPENLFPANSSVTTFYSTFHSCTALISIPLNLFANCPNVTTFSYCFYNCSSLIGNAPNIWNRTNVTGYNRCFYNCTNLDNYSSIKSGWK